MRRWLLVLILAVVIAGGNAYAKPHSSPAQICTQKAQTASGVRALIKCIAPKLGVSTSTALYIAYRESRNHSRICNSSDHCGVYQDAQAIWHYEVTHYVYGHLLGRLQPNCAVWNLTWAGRCNGRASVILNLRYVKHHGWGPWS